MDMKKWNKVIQFGLLGAALVCLAACGNEATDAEGSSAD